MRIRAAFLRSRTGPGPKRRREGPFTSNFKATPLMIGGVLYLNSPLSMGVALNARTGATKWVYNVKSHESSTTTKSARRNERGVAYWTDATEERIFGGTGECYPPRSTPRPAVRETLRQEWPEWT